jgi:hypothetical protein
MRSLVVVATLLLPGLAVGCALLRSASSVGEIMQTMVDPSARLIWGSVATSVTAAGIEEKYPRSEKEWNELKQAAGLLTEAGNRLKKESRAEGNSQWMRWSQALLDAAAETRTAVDAKRPDHILAAGEKIYNTCVGCHGRYSTMTAPP